VDPEWSIKLPTGFTWWADRHAQTIEIVGSEASEDGETTYLISTRTDLLRNLKLMATVAIAITKTVSTLRVSCPMQSTGKGFFPISITQVRVEPGKWRNY
jgi:hypothetical protein